ncbi:MAG: NAD(P)/FAD-dependent oxidoreductase [Emcibacteraceae bacterium]|nr:NAD(P)/FAD-dependent oxidoreductase [Emcibacteraceae bacterium]
MSSETGIDSSRSGAKEREIYDVAIVGGGVVGCAIARRFVLEGAKVILLEKGVDILSGASKANSAILHTGFDAPAGSLELQCVQAGYKEYLEIFRNFNLPILKTSAYVVAWTEEQLARLPDIEKHAHQNNVTNVHLIDREALLKSEPHLSNTALGAVAVPGEYVIDPWSSPLGYLTQAVLNGAAVRFGYDVAGGQFDGDTWQLKSSTQESIHTKFIINCAGLYGDYLDQSLLGKSEFLIKPRKGQFIVYDKSASALLNAIILPVPTERTKGIVLTRTIFGNLLLGPTAEEQDDRSNTSVTQNELENLKIAAENMVPDLKNMPVTATYAGLRPASECKEYRVFEYQEKNWITAGAIRSTGLTSSLGLASHIFAQYSKMTKPHTPPENIKTPKMPNLAEHAPRDWTQPGYGEIVCHCEMVTKREIDNALSSVIPAHDLSGLKRRTRATMGSCQAFYCSARLAELTKNRLSHDLSIARNGDDNE